MTPVTRLDVSRISKTVAASHFVARLSIFWAITFWVGVRASPSYIPTLALEPLLAGAVVLCFASLRQRRTAIWFTIAALLFFNLSLHIEHSHGTSSAGLYDIYIRHPGLLIDGQHTAPIDWFDSVMWTLLYIYILSPIYLIYRWATEPRIKSFGRPTSGALGPLVRMCFAILLARPEAAARFVSVTMLSGVVWPTLLASGLTSEINFLNWLRAAFNHTGLDLLVILLLWVVFGMLPGILLVRNELRRIVPQASAALTLDARQPILLLRSFKDDGASILPASAVSRLQRRRVRLEEVVASWLASIGPLIAVGNPSEKLPHLGAYREYFEEDTWKNKVVGWMHSCRFTVLIAGTTPWVRWELDQLKNKHLLRKTIILMPPKNAMEVAEIWAQLLASLDSLPVCGALSAENPIDVRAICIQSEDEVVVFRSRHKDQISYELAFDSALAVSGSLSRHVDPVRHSD